MYKIVPLTILSIELFRHRCNITTVAIPIISGSPKGDNPHFTFLRQYMTRSNITRGGILFSR